VPATGAIFPLAVEESHMVRHATLIQGTKWSLCLLSVLLGSCAAPSRVEQSGLSFSQEPLPGKVIWSDLVTDDVEAARRFYGDLLGWEFEDTTLSMGRKYVIARSGPMIVAGLVPVAQREGGAEISRWLPYLSVADVDAAVATATAGGATVAVGARDVALGRVAAIIDPEGAVIGLARSRIGDPDDRSTAPAAGRRVWTELLSNDPAASAAFYDAVAGYEVRTILRRGGEYTLLSSGGVDRAGILRNPTDGWSPVWLTSFGVADAVAAAARAEALGGRLLLAPSPEVRDGRMAIVADPSGAIVVLQQVEAG